MSRAIVTNSLGMEVAVAALSRMHMTDALIMRGQQNAFANSLRQLAGVTDETLEEAHLSRRLDQLAMHYGYGSRVNDKPFAFSNGVAIIPVHGALINRFFGCWGFVTGYNFIRAMLNAALEDDDVELIVFDVNSFGGEAAGCFELADEIRTARDRKSLLAVVDSNCCSAAYAIASACTKLVVTPSGQAGSIGVVAMHVDMSKFYKDWGLKITLIGEGPHKTDGNPYEALSDEVLADIRASVKKRYGEFIGLVVKNRADLTTESVRDTESRCYRADEALELKLIDAVETPTDAVASFLAELGDDQPNGDEDEEMTTAATKPGTPEAAAAAPAVDVGAVQKAERDRMSAIMDSEEGKANVPLANYFATKTDMTAEAAIGALKADAAGKATTPAPAAAAPTTPAAAAAPAAVGEGAFSAAMDNSDNPQLGAGLDANGQKLSRAQVAMANAGLGTAKAADTRVKHFH